MNKRSIFLPVAFALVLAAGLFTGKYLPTAASHDKLDEVLSLVRYNYVDTVSEEELKEKAINALLMNLDPHSAYIPVRMLRDVNDQLSGSFHGIGVQFRLLRDSILVIRTIAGGPSEAAGLHAGDRIVMVEGEKVAGTGITNQEVLDKLKGPMNTTVQVEVYRRGVKDLLPFTISRGEIPSKSVDISYMVDNRTGYIKVSRFSDLTYHEFSQALYALKQQGMQDLMLDLRGNSGGFLSAAVAMADEFLPPGTPIVYTEGRFRERETFNAERRGLHETGGLCILIDEYSASASEILAGAIQDNDRGLIVGRRSFGKGFVQEPFTLSDSSAIRLTVARYYTPTGRCIQRPYDEGHSAYFNDIDERYFSGELLHPDSIHFPDSLKYTTPAGKVVYGGGGIMPDVYVTIDSLTTAPFYNQLIRSELFYDFVVDYIDANRPALEKYGSAQAFIDQFQVGGDLLTQLFSYCRKGGLKPPSGIDADSDRLIRNRLKAFIGRDVYDDAAFYPVYLREDKVFLRAKELCSE